MQAEVSDIELLNGFMLVKECELDEVSKGGIILPPSDAKGHTNPGLYGEIVSLSKEDSGYDYYGNKIKNSDNEDKSYMAKLDIGDHVAFTFNAGYRLKLSDCTVYRAITRNEILCKICAKKKNETTDN
jgi:co-chaperonin GroES (HSP10)